MSRSNGTGSGADLGWEPWSVETGSTNTLIATMLALREGKESLLQVDRGRPWAIVMKALDTGVKDPAGS